MLGLALWNVKASLQRHLIIGDHSKYISYHFLRLLRSLGPSDRILRMTNLRLLYSGALALMLSACGTDEPYDHGSRRRAPAVSLPDRLSDRELELLPIVVRAIERAGFEIVNSGGGDYDLALHEEDGPINAIVNLKLYRGRRAVAEAEGKAGGPSIIFNRSGVIREALEKALDDFRDQIESIPHSGRSFYDRNERYERDRYERDSYSRDR